MIYQPSFVAVAIFFLFVAITLGISFYLGSKAKSSQGYFAAHGEIPWFVNGERSITEIWRLVRAEYGNVTTSSDPWKFAYVVTPETPDVLLADVAAYVLAMEEAGIVEIQRR